MDALWTEQILLAYVDQKEQLGPPEAGTIFKLLHSRFLAIETPNDGSQSF